VSGVGRGMSVLDGGGYHWRWRGSFGVNLGHSIVTNGGVMHSYAEVHEPIELCWWGRPRRVLYRGSHIRKGRGCLGDFSAFTRSLVWIGRKSYFLHRNVFDSYVKSWQYFRTDKISLESMFYWLCEDIVRFKIEVVVCKIFDQYLDTN